MPLRNAPEGGISCERGPNDEEPIGALDDTIAAANRQFASQNVFFERKKSSCQRTCAPLFLGGWTRQKRQNRASSISHTMFIVVIETCPFRIYIFWEGLL
jgi:hypothetical protein